MLITAGVAPSIKLGNEVKRASLVPLTPSDCEKYARELMAAKELGNFYPKR